MIQVRAKRAEAIQWDGSVITLVKSVGYFTVYTPEQFEQTYEEVE